MFVLVVARVECEMDDVRDRVGGQTWKNNSGEDFREARPARAFVPPPTAGAADLEEVTVLSVGWDRSAGAEEDRDDDDERPSRGGS